MSTKVTKIELKDESSYFTIVNERGNIVQLLTYALFKEDILYHIKTTNPPNPQLERVKYKKDRLTNVELKKRKDEAKSLVKKAVEDSYKLNAKAFQDKFFGSYIEENRIQVYNEHFIDYENGLINKVANKTAENISNKIKNDFNSLKTTAINDIKDVASQYGFGIGKTVTINFYASVITMAFIFILGFLFSITSIRSARIDVAKGCSPYGCIVVDTTITKIKIMNK